ncbi:hypothetical protein D3C87_373340 [compost metagenome]
MMKKKCLALLLTMFFSLIISAQTTKEYKPELDLIFKAFKEKNYDLIKNLLDSDMKIGDLPTGMNDQIIPQIIEQFPEPLSYTIKNTTSDGKDVHVETVYNTALIPEFTWRFTFNKEGKIIDFDVLSDVATETRTLQK